MTAAFGTFFNPGPTEVRPEVLRAMSRPMIGHRGAVYEALHRNVVAGLQHVFRTARPVYLMTASGTGLMEAAVRCAPEGPVLSLVNGAFSERFARIAQACDRRTRVLAVPWGETHPLDLVEQALADETFAAMTVVHSETSTGALSDVRALTELAHRYGTMCLVDSVSGVGGNPLETDAWGLDFVFTGSQKALALPPGMAFGVASEPYILQAGATPGRGRYFDLVEFEEYSRRSQVPQTPALPILFAAEAQLAAIAEEGIERRWARHAAMLDAAERWSEGCIADGIEVPILARPGERSATVSAFRLPEGVKSGVIVRRVEELGYTIATGFGVMRETAVRVGHMGDHTVDGLVGCLAALREALFEAKRAR